MKILFTSRVRFVYKLAQFDRVNNIPFLFNLSAKIVAIYMLWFEGFAPFKRIDIPQFWMRINMKKTHNDWPIVFHWTVQPVRVYISGSGSLRKHMKKPHYGFQWSVGVYQEEGRGCIAMDFLLSGAGIQFGR